MTTGDSFSRIREQAERQLRDNPPPTLLSKADALEFAAKCLDRNSASLSLVTSLLEIAGATRAAEPVIVQIKQYAMHPELQIAAMKAAAGAIRDLALEERVIAARAERHGAGK
jgi:hypothetical protein